jgi:hypothetical protein
MSREFEQQQKLLNEYKSELALKQQSEQRLLKDQQELRQKTSSGAFGEMQSKLNALKQVFEETQIVNFGI